MSDSPADKTIYFTTRAMTTLATHMTPDQLEEAAADVREQAAQEPSASARQLLERFAEGWDQFASERRAERS